ncbi:MAG TPA: cytochrome c3 family protein [Thermoanaerobaculia bacterium]|nr:cytochrome c3 family protein [Thermoanaerobaculia bacterium]
MRQLFPRGSNAVSRASIVVGLLLLAGVAGSGALLSNSGYSTGEGVFLNQPVPFSHDHHTAGLGIDCRYCHTGVEVAASAGIPPISTCMNCHKQIWTNAELLEPIRAAYREGVAVEWERVHDLPDFVYFDHSVHVTRGIGCETCHGRVDQMPLMYQESSLTMGWCLECHRDPAKYVRPKEEVFTFGWEPPVPQRELGPQLVEQYGIQTRTSCSACHR